MALKGSRRALRTVLFTDIVGSTELAAELGDRRWRRTVAAHHALIRRELKRHHGSEVDTAGDGFFALFENPTDALRCASAAVAGVHGIGLRIRGAIHTGEVEPAGEKVGGIAVHIGARLLAMAGVEEVLVSSTVRDLAAGSGHEFEDRGIHELRGVPGEWHAYALVLPQLEQSLGVGAADDEEDRRAATIRQQRMLLGGLVGFIAILLLSIGAALVLVNRPPASPTGADTLVAFGNSGDLPVRGWAVGRGPQALALGKGAIWLASTDSGTLSRIDLGTGDLVTVGQGGDRPSAVHVAADRVWVADRYSSQLAVLDAADGQLVERLDEHVAALADLGGHVWMADDLHDRLVAIDPTTSEEFAVISLPAPAGSSDLTAASGVLWVAAWRSDQLLRVDPISRASQPIDTGVSNVEVLTAYGTDLWLASPAGDTVARLDAASGRVHLRVTVCDTPIAIAPLADGAWVACAGDTALWRLDLAGAVSRRIDLDAVPADLVADADEVFVALRAD